MNDLIIEKVRVLLQAHNMSVDDLVSGLQSNPGDQPGDAVTPYPIATPVTEQPEIESQPDKEVLVPEEEVEIETESEPKQTMSGDLQLDRAKLGKYKK